jgi:hypothetical protein
MIARREDILRALSKVFEIRYGFRIGGLHHGFRLALTKIAFVLRERNAGPAVKNDALARNAECFF